MSNDKMDFLRRLAQGQAGARETFIAAGLPASCHPVGLQFSHRANLRETLFERAFQHGGLTTLLTIKSVHTLTIVQNKLPECVATNTRIRVLALDPNTDPAVLATLARHLGERPAEVVRGVREAWEEWGRLKALFPDNLDVLCFSSLPVWQGYVVGEEYAVIEFLSFRQDPNSRPANRRGGRSRSRGLSTSRQFV